MKSYALVCVTGPELGRRFRVGMGMVEVGRTPRVAICLRDRSVSRTHAFFRSRSKGIAIGDAHSRNGTFVNGKRIASFVPLNDGDLIQMGQTLLRFCAPPLRLRPVVMHRAVDKTPSAPPRRLFKTVPARPRKLAIERRAIHRLLLAAAAVAGFASFWLFWLGT